MFYIFSKRFVLAVTVRIILDKGTNYEKRMIKEGMIEYKKMFKKTLTGKRRLKMPGN